MGARPGPTGRFYRGVFSASVLLCCLGLAFTAVRAAAAEPYAPPVDLATEPPAPEGQPGCPTGELAPSEGEDVAAGEVRLLRAEAMELCAALSARLDRVRERLWWLTAEALAASEQRARTNAKLTELVESSCGNPCEVSINAKAPVPVADSASAQYSDELVSAVDASGEASKGALYFIAGLIVAGLVGYLLSRVVDRGT